MCFNIIILFETEFCCEVSVIFHIVKVQKDSGGNNSLLRSFTLGYWRVIEGVQELSRYSLNLKFMSFVV